MTISEYITKLEALRAEHGDIEVESMAPDCSRREAPAPSAQHKKILAGRQHKSMFWSRYTDRPETKGEPVVQV